MTQARLPMEPTPAARADVAILGGGLAGLTLAIQLRQRNPGLDVAVIERRAHPVREAAHKVGESTVEIGARYFADVLGLREHLDAEQLRKFGFRFFFSEGQQRIDACTELGVSKLLPTPSWQIDRGRFENFLGEHARRLGVAFHDGAVVRGIDLDAGEPAQAAGDHVVRFEQAGALQALHARWVVDASGRAGLLKKKLDLAQPNDHDANAVWWRVDGFIDPNDWSDDPQWLARCTPPDRWRSTNHMCGPGYWFWLIPLSSGAHSLGIVCDAKMHPLDTMNTHAKAMDWLRAHQPRVAQALEKAKDGAPVHGLQDFMFLRHFSYGCKQVFSGQRWALTGEAGLFLDPFYSPGSDFIAISNGYICDLIEKDRAGQAFAPYAEIYQQLYFSFYANTLTLYQDQYPIFGDAQVMPVKVIWDYTYYWGLLAPLYFADKLTDLALLSRLRPQFQRAAALNVALQALVRDWSARNRARSADGAPPLDGRMLDQSEIGWFREMNRALDDVLDDAALRQRLADNVARMAWLAQEILQRARHQYPDLPDHGLAALLEDNATTPSLAVQWYAEAA
jgi:flavin-dependent dehydrogenase